MTQQERILQHIDRHGSITALEALQKYGIMRLPARINDLRKAGYAIKTDYVKAKNRYGQPVCYASYKRV